MERSPTRKRTFDEGQLQNPLLLDVVLANVFDCLPLPDLLKCRAVCKTWCCNSTLKHRIRLRAEVSVRDIFLQTSTTLDNLPNYFKLSGPIYSNFNFQNVSYNHKLVQRLFDLMGPEMIRLRLHLNLHQMNVEQFRTLIYEKLPNLRELCIFSLSSEEVYKKPLFPPEVGVDPPTMLPSLERLELQEVRFPITEFMTQFMETTPNLREVILKTEVCSDWSEQAEMWRQNSAIATSVVRALKDSGAFRTLKELRCGKLRRDHLESLELMGRSGLRLEILEVHAPSKDLEDLFTQFLETQKDSLQQLILFEQRSYLHGKRPGDPERVFMLRLPEVMPRLEVLQLSKYQKAVMVPIHPVDFTRQCPRLRRLILLGFDYGESPCGNLYLPEVGSETVEELVLWATCDEFQRERRDPQVISRAFVNLTKLTLSHPTKHFVSCIWGHCEKLKVLKVTLQESKYMDEAFTGIAESEIGRWIRTPEKLMSLKVLDQRRSILNLKDLQILQITVDHDEESERQALCDATAYLALGSMKQLRHLNLLSSHWTIGLTECLFFSKKSQVQLRQVLKFTVVRFAP